MRGTLEDLTWSSGT